MRLIILLLFLVSLSASAQWTSDTTVNTTVRDTLGSTTPLMASRNDGSTYICWFEQGVNGYELRMQLLDSNGIALWSPGGIVVSNQPQSSALFRYELKIDHEENAIVAFQDTRTGGDLHVAVNKVTQSGSLPWGNGGIQLIDSLSTEGLAPAIGIAFNNNIYVAWNADNASGKWIACQYISDTGNILWSQPYRVRDTVGNLNYSRPKLFPIGTSIQMVYVEESGNFPGVTSTLFTQRFDSLGVNHFPSPVQLSTKTIPYFFFPEPHPDDNGGFFVAFNTGNPVNISLNDVYVQYCDFNGALWSTTGTEAANSTSEHKTTPSSCYVSSLNEFFVLLQVQDGGQSMSGLSIQRFDGSGNTMLGANGINLFPVSSIYYLPRTITDALNGIIVSTSFGTFGQEQLIAAKVDYNGTMIWSGNQLCSVNSNKDDLSSGKFILNNLVFVWQDDRNGSGIFAQNLNGDGQPGITTGINNLSSDVFILFPNPSERFTLQFADNTDKEITVCDMSGRIIYSEKIPAATSHFSPIISAEEGLYFVSVRNGTDNQKRLWKKVN